MKKILIATALLALFESRAALAQNQDVSQTDSQAVTGQTFTEDSAKKLIDEMGQKVLSIFGSSQKYSHKKEGFEKLFLEYFNAPLIAKHALRKKWRSFSMEEKKEYISLFEKDIIYTYFNLLEKYYQNDKFFVLKAETEKDNAQLFSVLSEIRRSNGQTIVIKWQVYKNKILDAIVEKVSTSHAKYNEYREIYRKNGSTTQGFLQALKKKVEQMAEKSNAR